MGAVHNRWELVEPLLFAHSLRDPASFHESKTSCTPNAVLRAIRGEHRLEEADIAQAFSHLGNFNFDEEQKLHEIIRRNSTRWLDANGDHWILRMDARPGHEIIRWRGLTLLVPSSIIVAGALSATGRKRPFRVQVLPDSLAPREAVGHLHVHLGPMLPFEMLWSELWYAFLQRGSLDARRGRGIAGIDEVPEIGRYASKRQPGLRWQWLLELAFAARVWLIQRGEDQLLPVLRAFGRGQVEVERRAGALLELWSWPAWRDVGRREARRLAQLRLAGERERQRRSTRATGVPAELPPAPRPDDFDDEIRFLSGALDRCITDGAYARVFYQYLRVKVALHRHMVVDPWTIGLRHFLDVVRRDDPYDEVIANKKRLNELRIEAARKEQPLDVKAIEIHVFPDSWLKMTPQRTPKYGWVLSFRRAGKPERDDPTGARAAANWRLEAQKAATTCRLLARIMAFRPSILKELRGLGLMDWERNGPVWLYAQAFRRLLHASEDVAAAHPRLRLRPIQTALHLGEDFDHLLSGLRQIFEPFEWGLIRRGDRIGHALALGLSSEMWCERHPWVRMRPWDRILDIGFSYWMLGALGVRIDSDQMERMRMDARDAMYRIFKEHLGRDPLEVARGLWLALPGPLPKSMRPSAEPIESFAQWRELIDRIGNEPSVGWSALALSFTVETKHELPLLKAIQTAVHDRVAKTQVAIEICPSSNLLVGGFRSIFEQPIFHSNDLPITLNADDPLTFDTSLAADYAYAWAGMVLGSGQNPDQATRRLEDAARCSMRYAFGSYSGTRS